MLELYHELRTSPQYTIKGSDRGLRSAKEHAAPAFSDVGLRDLANQRAHGTQHLVVKTVCKKLSPLQRTVFLLFAHLAGPAARAPAASQDKQFMMCQRRARALLQLPLQPRDPRATVVQPQARIRRWCPRCARVVSTTSCVHDVHASPPAELRDMVDRRKWTTTGSR